MVKHILLFIGSLLVGLILILAPGLAAPALAQCVPAGTAGDDVVICAGVDPTGTNTLTGRDTITVLPGAVVQGTLATNLDGNDTVIIMSGGRVTPPSGQGGIHLRGYYNAIRNLGEIWTDDNDAVRTDEGRSRIENGGLIRTSSDWSYGIASDVGNLILNSGLILTLGDNSRGIFAGGTVINQGAITTHGETAAAIFLRDSNNTVRNTGTLTTTGLNAVGIQGGSGNDIIDNSGNIRSSGASINAGAGDDTVVISGGQITGLIDGGSGTDSLIFRMSIAPDGIEALAAELAAAAPGGGTITIHGQTYTWVNFEDLVNQLYMAIFYDGRLNAGDIAATVVLYAVPIGGVDLWALDDNGGVFAFRVGEDTLRAALQQAVASGQHVLIEERLGVSLWALSSDQLQGMGPGGYIYVFNPYRVGLEEYPH